MYLAHGNQHVSCSFREARSDVGSQKLSVMFLARSTIWDIRTRDVWLSVLPDIWTCLKIGHRLPDAVNEQHPKSRFLQLLLLAWWSDVRDGTAKSEHCAARNRDHMQKDNRIRPPNNKAPIMTLHNSAPNIAIWIRGRRLGGTRELLVFDVVVGCRSILRISPTGLRLTPDVMIFKDLSTQN